MPKKVVAVLGATGAVGHAVTRMIAKEGVMGDGFKVLAIASDEAKLKELAGEFKDAGVVTERADATNIKELQRAFDAHSADGVCSVINLIGDFAGGVPLADTSADDLMATVQDNLLAGFNVLKVACPLLAAQGGGSLVAIGAASCRYGLRHHEAWNAAKGAVEAMHRSAAATHAAANVRINIVAPGLIEGSPQSEQLTADKGAESTALYPLKKLATPEDVAWAACWLAHPRTTHTTGATLPVDGGLSLVAAAGLAGPAAAAAAAEGGKAAAEGGSSAKAASPAKANCK